MLETSIAAAVCVMIIIGVVVVGTVISRKRHQRTQNTKTQHTIQSTTRNQETPVPAPRRSILLRERNLNSSFGQGEPIYETVLEDEVQVNLGYERPTMVTDSGEYNGLVLCSGYDYYEQESTYNEEYNEEYEPPSQLVTVNNLLSQPLTADRLPSQPVGVDNPSLQLVIANRPLSQPVTVDKPASQPIIIDRPFSQPVSADKPPSQRVNVDRPSSQTVTVDKPPSQPVTLDRLPLQPITDDKPLSQPVSAECIDDCQQVAVLQHVQDDEACDDVEEKVEEETKVQEKLS